MYGRGLWWGKRMVVADEIRKIEAVVKVAEGILARLDNEILRLDAMASTLDMHLNRLRDEITIHRASLPR